VGAGVVGPFGPGLRCLQHFFAKLASLRISFLHYMSVGVTEKQRDPFGSGRFPLASTRRNQYQYSVQLIRRNKDSVPEHLSLH